MTDNRVLFARVPEEVHARIAEHAGAAGVTITAIVEHIIRRYYGLPEGTPTRIEQTK